MRKEKTIKYMETIILTEEMETRLRNSIHDEISKLFLEKIIFL